jgi:AcrR family transcriptional regulator
MSLTGNGTEARGRRRYEKRVRAAREAETRSRIAVAALGLLEEAGPAAVTVSAVARRAGVQRLTVYRHFPGGRGLVEASAAWETGKYPPPDPAEWAAIPDPAKRLRRALRRLYGFYREVGPVLGGGQRFFAAGASEGAPPERYFQGVLATVEPGWVARGKRPAALEAGLNLALRYETWHSLCAESGLEDKAAARMMVRFIRSLARKAR